MSFLIINILESFLGHCKRHNDTTGQAQFGCPSCAESKGLYEDDKKYNLEVNYEKGVFKCWACAETHNMKGPIQKLIKRYGTKKNLQDYLLLKPDTANYSGSTDTDAPVVQLSLPEGYKELISATPRDYKYDRVIKYLSDRGITRDIIEEFKIGFTTKGRFSNRIIIPSYDVDNNLNYFIARAFEYKTKPKYLNPDAEKQNIIFNESLINWDSTIYLVEGVFDAIVCNNAIPLLGKFLSNKLKQTLNDKAKGFIVVLLDSDAYDDALRLVKELSFGNLRGRIRICIPPSGYDPSMVHEIGGRKRVINLLRGSRVLNNSERN